MVLWSVWTIGLPLNLQSSLRLTIGLPADQKFDWIFESLYRDRPMTNLFPDHSPNVNQNLVLDNGLLLPQEEASIKTRGPTWACLDLSFPWSGKFTMRFLTSGIWPSTWNALNLDHTYLGYLNVKLNISYTKTQVRIKNAKVTLHTAILSRQWKIIEIFI
jgi:hypothetical protein